MLFLILSCHGDDSAAPGADAYDCVELMQNAPDGTTVPSGYEHCLVDRTEGFVHRTAAIDVAIDATTGPDNPFCAKEHTHGCRSDADCSEGSVCDLAWFAECVCIPKCTKDAECGDGFACIPDVLPDAHGKGGRGGNGECHRASCRSDDDCPSGLCVLSAGGCSGVQGLQCFGPNDDCRTSADCAAPGDLCLSDGVYPFHCDPNEITCE